MGDFDKLETELKLRGFSEKTVQSYLFYNQKFLEFVNKSAEEITEDNIKEFIAKKMEENASSRSIALIKASLKFYYDDVLNKNIVNIRTPKISRKLPVVLSKVEIKRMLDSTKNKKHKLIIELIYSSGLRLSECVNLRKDNLELEEGIGWVRKGKGSKDRMFIISEKLKEKLRKHMDKYPGEYLFIGRNGKLSVRAIQKLVGEAVKRAKINKNVSVHTLRHSFATHLLDNGVDIRRIQELLGHSNLQTTQIYAHVSTEELKKVKSPLDNL